MASSEKLKKIVSGASFMAAAYFLSRVLGLIRHMAIAWRFGAKHLTDIYVISFVIPDFLFYLLAGGAFSIVLIPMLAKHVTADSPQRLDDQGSELFARIFFPFTALAILLTVLLLVAAPQLSAWLYPEFKKNLDTFRLLVRLTRIVLPAQLCFLCGGLFTAVLRTCGDFRGNAWGPNIYNLGIIFGTLLLSLWLGIAGISYGVLLGACSGPLLLSVLLSRKYLHLRYTRHWFSPELGEYILLSLPLMLGFSLLTVDQWFVRYFGARPGIAAGTITCLEYARTVMLIPIGLIGQSTGQALLTYLAPLWQQNKKEEFSATFLTTLRGVLYLAFISAGGLFAVALPVITLLFRRGAFSLANTRNTASLLQWMILAIPAFACQQSLVNGYYARKNTLRPMIISTLTAISTFFIYAGLQKSMAGPGIALASALGFWLLLLVTLYDYQHTYGRAEGFAMPVLLATAGKSLGISALACAGATFLIRHSGLLPVKSASILNSCLLLAITLLLYGSAVLILTLLAGGQEAAILRKVLHLPGKKTNFP